MIEISKRQLFRRVEKATELDLLELRSKEISSSPPSETISVDSALNENIGASSPSINTVDVNSDAASISTLPEIFPENPSTASFATGSSSLTDNTGQHDNLDDSPLFDLNKTVMKNGH